MSQPPEPRAPSGKADGFTLLEVLIAIAVLGFLLAGLAAGTHFGIGVLHRQATTQADRESLGTTDRVFRALIAAAEPFQQGQAPSFSGGPAALVLRTRLPVAANLLIARDVVAQIGVDADARLVLRVTPLPRAHWISPPPVLEEALTERVKRIDLAYWQPGTGGSPGRWVANWAARQPPPLVRLRVVPWETNARRWPDIVAATARDPLSDPN